MTTRPAIVAHPEPEDGNCPGCGAEAPFEHYTVDTDDGTLCEDCAWDTGLGDAAHGLSLVKDALIRTVQQHDRDTVRRYCTELAGFAAGLADGSIVAYLEGPNGEIHPQRPGGDDPHATIRRHVIRPVTNPTEQTGPTR